MIGSRYRDLARHYPARVPRAVRYIGQALVLRDGSKQRSRRFDLIGLAGVHLITGEAEQAAALIGQALPLAGERAPGRVDRKLGDFYRETARWAAVPAAVAVASLAARLARVRQSDVRSDERASRNLVMDGVLSSGSGASAWWSAFSNAGHGQGRMPAGSCWCPRATSLSLSSNGSC